MNNILQIARITFLEGVRNRVLFGVLIVALLFCGISLLIVPMFAFDTGKVAIDISFACISLIGLSIIFFLAIPLLSQDIFQLTVTIILSRPVSRGEYIAGKFVGLAMTIAVSFTIIGVIAAILFGLGIQFSQYMVLPRNLNLASLSLAIVFAYFSQLLVLAAAFLFSTLTTSSYLAMLLTLAFYFCGNSLETILRIVASREFFLANETYQFLLVIISWIFPNLTAFDMKIHVAYGLPISWQYASATFLYGVFYVLILLSISVVLFQRKELQ